MKNDNVTSTLVVRRRTKCTVAATLTLASLILGSCASTHVTKRSAAAAGRSTESSTTVAVRRKSTAVVFGEPHAEKPCHPTVQQRAAAGSLVADTKHGLARLADIKRAEAEGYMRFGDVPILGTWHYINWAYQADGDVLDPTRPESIIYWKASTHSDPVLIGAMYVMPHANDVGPQIGGCLTVWHVHGPPFAPAGQVTNEMLHVWLIPMPDGPFA